MLALALAGCGAQNDQQEQGEVEQEVVETEVVEVEIVETQGGQDAQAGDVCQMPSYSSFSRNYFVGIDIKCTTPQGMLYECGITSDMPLHECYQESLSEPMLRGEVGWIDEGWKNLGFEIICKKLREDCQRNYKQIERSKFCSSVLPR